MITKIGYADGRYFIWVDGHCVDSASTQHEADVLLSTIQEAEASWQMGGMSNVGQPTLRCGLPNPLYRVQQSEVTEDLGGPGGIDLYAAALEEDDEMRQCQGCGAPATLEVPFATEPYYEYYCDACCKKRYYSGNPLPQSEQRPLLAQCAEVIRACLGGPMVTSGIVDELRRVERALAEEGW